MQINLKPMTTPIQMFKKRFLKGLSCFRVQKTPGCVKSFQRFSNLENHLDFGKHTYALERETLFDKAMLSYPTKLDKRDTSLECQTSDDLSSCCALYPLPKGWAQKSSTVLRKRFSQKLYLSKLFDVGEQTGHKLDANNVSKSMRKARNIDSSFLFDASEYLTAKQIASFFFLALQERRERLKLANQRKRKRN